MVIGIDLLRCLISFEAGTEVMFFLYKHKPDTAIYEYGRVTD